MRTPEHTAKPASPPRTGRLATLPGPRRANGSGAPSHAPIVAVLAVVFALLGGALQAVPALALTNPERAYEMVSPVFKGGYGARHIVGVAPNGESVDYQSGGGAFAGDGSDLGFLNYQATRTGSEWSSAALNPPAALNPDPFQEEISPSLEASLWQFRLGIPNTQSGELSTEERFYVRTAAGFHPVGPVFKRQDGLPLNGVIYRPEAVSSDLCHIVFYSSLTPTGVFPNAEGEHLQEVDAGCHGAPGLKVVAVNNAGGLLSPECTPILGGSSNDERNAVAADGSTVFFGDRAPTGSSGTGDSGACGEEVANEQLFARVGGARTLEVSKPLAEACSEVPCPGAATRGKARFLGASEDGSRVFFETVAPLEPASDHDSKNDLYMATIGCPGEASGCEAGQRVVTSLVQVSHDPNPGEAAELQGVVSIAPDGSHVYFVAHGVLSGQGLAVEGVQSAPVAGADNLYGYERDGRYPAGRTVFVSEICSGPGVSGGVPDSRCPDDLESGAGASVTRNDLRLLGVQGPVQVAGSEGGVLVFSTYAQLVDRGPEADTDDAQDVYRFDMGSGSLLRVSLGEGGADANGNHLDEMNLESGQGYLGDADARIPPIVGSSQPQEAAGFRRAVSEDGSRIVFSTADPLSPAAINGLTDIYEWHDGAVSLISSGTSVEPDEEAVITPSGRDVFFVTSQGLVPQDTDGAPDVYDARIGGGFPVPASEPERCRGDACQGSLTNPAPLLVPGSVAQAPGENLPAPVSTSPAAKAKPAKPKKCAKGYVKKRARCVKAKVKRRARTRAKKSQKGVL